MQMVSGGEGGQEIKTFHDQLQPFTTNCNLSRLGQIIKINYNRKSIKKTPDSHKKCICFSWLPRAAQRFSVIFQSWRRRL